MQRYGSREKAWIRVYQNDQRFSKSSADLSLQRYGTLDSLYDEVRERYYVSWKDRLVCYFFRNDLRNCKIYPYHEGKSERISFQMRYGVLELICQKQPKKSVF